MFRMIWFHTVKNQAENDFSDICFKPFSLFFFVSFYLFCTRAWIIQIVGSQDLFWLEVLIKVIWFIIKFKIFDFHYPHIPFCNFQNSIFDKMRRWMINYDMLINGLTSLKLRENCDTLNEMISEFLLFKNILNIDRQTFLWKVKIKHISILFNVITTCLHLGFFFWRYD